MTINNKIVILFVMQSLILFGMIGGGAVLQGLGGSVLRGIEASRSLLSEGKMVLKEGVKNTVSVVSGRVDRLLQRPVVSPVTRPTPTSVVARVADPATGVTGLEIIRPNTSPYYSTIVQAELTPKVHFPGRSDKVHFQEANKQLYSNITSNSEYAQMMEQHYPGITKAVSPSLKGVFPTRPPIDLGLTWHHNSYQEGLLELIPRIHHRAPGVIQSNLHPNQRGGMEIWGGGRKNINDKN